MVSLTGRRTRSEIVALLDTGRARNGALRKFAFRDATGGRRDVPDHPVQHIIGAAAKDGVDVMKDDGVRLRGFWSAGKFERRLYVAASPRVLLGDDSSIRPGICSHHQRRNVEPASPTSTTPSASASATLSATLSLRRR